MQAFRDSQSSRTRPAAWAVAILCLLFAGQAPAQSLFWSDWGPNSTPTSLRRLDLPSGQQQVLRSGSPGNVGPQPHNFGPMGIALDPARGHLYYGDVNSNSIDRINFDGTGHTTLVTGTPGVSDVALDLAGGRIYWTDVDQDRIRRANLDGSNVQDVVTTNLINASGLTLDPARGRIYWSDFHRDVIGSARLDGSDVRLAPTPGGGPIDVAIDPVNNRVIWSDFDTYRIYRADPDLTPGSVQTIVTLNNTTLPGSLAVDPVGQHLYWVDWGMSRIRRSNLDGTNVVDVYAPGTQGPASLSGLAFLPVPEPSAAGVVLIGLAAGLCRRRRRTP